MTPEIATRAARDVLSERLRQINQEGFTAEHDDKHSNSQLAAAAAVHTLSAVIGGPHDLAVRGLWPIGIQRKPKSRRRNLVIAAALLIAEIERLDRAAARTGTDA